MHHWSCLAHAYRVRERVWPCQGNVIVGTIRDRTTADSSDRQKPTANTGRVRCECGGHSPLTSLPRRLGRREPNSSMTYDGALRSRTASVRSYWLRGSSGVSSGSTQAPGASATNATAESCKQRRSTSHTPEEGPRRTTCSENESTMEAVYRPNIWNGTPEEREILVGRARAVGS